MSAVADDLLSGAVLRDPYPALAELRERAPVHWSERYRAWLLTSYEDCSAAHTDPRFSSDRMTPMLRKLEADGAPEALLATFRVLSGWMTFKSGREHRRLRDLVIRAFTPRTVARLETDIAEVAGALLDDLEGRTHADLVATLAFPLPAIVIAQMLGVPPQDRERFKAWSTDIALLVFGAADDDERHERGAGGMGELVAYLGDLIDAARDGERDDLLALLVRVRTSDGDALTRDELIAMCTLLLFAGHETTANLLSVGILSLLRHPEQAARLMAERAPATVAVEELLRFDGPARINARVAGEDFTLRGHEIRAGQRVYLVLAAANRDPQRFERPDELDLTRDPNPHVGFGLGPHYCLGAPLARLEGRIAIPMALRRLEGLRLTGEELQWDPVLLTRSLRALPVTFDRLAAA